MSRELARQIISTALVGIAVSFGVSAQPRPPQATPGAAAPAIRLRAVTFTPARGERPAIPGALTMTDVPAGRRGYYIVQFDGPIEDPWKSSIEATGAEILDYIPEFALKVRASPADANQIARTPRVLWVGAFHPAYKLPTNITRDGRLRPYTVRLERGADAASAGAEIAATGARVVHRSPPFMTIAASDTQLDAVARVLDVADIEAFALHEKHNEFGGSIMRAEIAAAAGYDGSTQIIAVTDTGLGGGTVASAHQDLTQERIAGIFNWTGAPSACFETIVADGPVDVDTGHGTHVATSALGGGTASGIGRGTAPGSRLVFQAIEDFVVPSFLCQILLGLAPGYYLAGIPADIGALFQQSYAAGARVHSNSWGSASAGAYTADSANADAFVWAHRYLTITVSAGNSGTDANADGLVDAGSINAPGTAKNVITIGASEGDRGTSYDCDVTTGSGCTGQNSIFTYGEAFGSAFRASPLRDDATAGNAQQMAAFSSRGPTNDGRIKPDVVAPGTWILSGYSDQFQQHYDPAPNPQNGAYQYDGWGYPLDAKYKYLGGTSMSAPLVAGAAAVVRDYYLKAHGHSASAALVKATLINSAVDLLDENNDGVDDNAFAIPNIHEGWGGVDLAAAIDPAREYVDEATPVTTGSATSRTVTVDTSGRPLRITLVWTDAPAVAAAATTLVNDLDLEVTAPDGTIYRGNAFVDGWTIPGGGAPDRVNNVESVYVANPASGEWTITVRGDNVPRGPQPFALVMGRQAAPVTQIARVSVTATTPVATEAGRVPAVLTFSRTGDVANALSIAYEVSGNATPGADFVALSGAVEFGPGSAEATVVVMPVDDAAVEGAETLTVTVVAGQEYGVRHPASAAITIVSDDQPGDLRVLSVSAPSVAAGGAPISITETTRNAALWPTEPSETGFYLSVNTSLDASDTFLGSRAVPTLPADATDTRTMLLTLPPDVAGAYYVIAKADYGNQVVESLENNNTRASSVIRVGPDLGVSAFTVPAHAGPGSTISVTDTTRNTGPQSTGRSSMTGYYLSSNAVLDAGDVRVGARIVGELPAGAQNQGTGSVTVPLTTEVGSYYLIARADDEFTINEANEANNTRAASSLKIGPDLITTAVSVPALAGAGGAIAINDTTRNQGGAAAAESITAFYLSENLTVDPADRRLGMRPAGAIEAGASSLATTIVTLPDEVPVGTYYVIAFADDGAAVTETSETNNGSRSGTIRIGPDFTVTTLVVPTSIVAGTTITISGSIKNAGGGVASPSTARAYLSVNSTVETSDVVLTAREVPELAAGDAHAFSATVVVPAETAAGIYSVIVNANDDSRVRETVTVNNTRRISVKVTAGTP